MNQMNAVMDCDHQLCLRKERSLVMWYVQNVRVAPSYQCGNRPLIDDKAVALGLVELRKIRRQRPQFMEITLRTDQQIFVSGIERCNVPDEIPDISSNAEFMNLPDVNRDSHGEIGHTLSHR